MEVFEKRDYFSLFLFFELDWIWIGTYAREGFVWNADVRWGFERICM